MPLKVSPISQAEQNALLVKARGRTRRVPRNPALLGLIVEALLARWSSSSKSEDKHNSRWIEAIAGLEHTMELAGYDVLGELEKQDFGLFCGPLHSIASGSLRALRASDHDKIIIRQQDNFLKEYVIKHALPARFDSHEASRWLKVHWSDIDQALRKYPCHCEYRNCETILPEISGLKGPKGLIARKVLIIYLLASLHQNGTEDSIKKALTRSRQ